MNQRVILASTSPRRQELLRQIGVEFEVVPSNASEDFGDGMKPVDVVRMLAERKGASVASQNPTAFVIAADTVVTVDGEILGKPGTPQRAYEMLEMLSGRTHQVVTGIAFLLKANGIRDVVDVTTDVTFGRLAPEVIRRYVETGEPLDKAGAYGIQGFGAVLVESISGSYYNVVGLPLYEIGAALERHLGTGSYLGGKT